ncbi:hypothetical protein AAC387_Pa02g2119 [Persea americana]
MGRERFYIYPARKPQDRKTAWRRNIPRAKTPGPKNSMEKKYSEGEDSQDERQRGRKPPFRLAQDDTKPALQDPIVRSDPIDSEQAVLRLPPFTKSQQLNSDIEAAAIEAELAEEAVGPLLEREWQPNDVI